MGFKSDLSGDFIELISVLLHQSNPMILFYWQPDKSQSAQTRQGEVTESRHSHSRVCRHYYSFIVPPINPMDNFRSVWWLTDWRPLQGSPRPISRPPPPQPRCSPPPLQIGGSQSQVSISASVCPELFNPLMDFWSNSDSLTVQITEVFRHWPRDGGCLGGAVPRVRDPGRGHSRRPGLSGGGGGRGRGHTRRRRGRSGFQVFPQPQRRGLHEQGGAGEKAWGDQKGKFYILGWQYIVSNLCFTIWTNSKSSWRLCILVRSPSADQTNL